MNKSESKYFNTALLMDEALIALLEEKDLKYITIKEICEKAGVNRSTFYLHYETIADLADEAMETVTNRFFSYFTHGSDEYIGKIPDKELNDLVFITKEYLRPYLQFIYDNKNIYRAVFRNPHVMQANTRYTQLKKYLIEPILERFEVPVALHRYHIAYYMEGIMAIIKEWLHTDCQDSVDVIANVIEACVKPPFSTEGKQDGE